MKQHRILIATDVPFWRKSTGAQTRINSLVEFLVSESFVVRTFYLGQTGSDRYTENDRQLIAEQQLDVDQQSSDQIPKSWTRKIGWYADQIRPRRPAKLSNGKDRTPDEPASDSNPRPGLEPLALDPLCLDDFRWPWASKAFSETIDQFKPDSILIEYVKLSYLIDCLSSQQRNSIHCVIDTHDALHVRCERFKERGLKHWIEISRDEEANELNKFDTVIAIQPDEAKLFQTMAPSAKTIVCGHAPRVGRSGGQSESTEDSPSCNQTKFSIGYLASTNNSNAQAIKKFLDFVWLPVSRTLNRQGSNAKIELVIGGSICEFVAGHLETNLSNIRLIGHVEELVDFYESVDAVINPVEFGTGLKIKSVEGLAFGKPLLTTAEGVLGLDLAQSTHDPIVVCDTPDQFALEVEQLALNPSRLMSLKNAAAALTKSAFSPQQSYSELKRRLLCGK